MKEQTVARTQKMWTMCGRWLTGVLLLAPMSVLAVQTTSVQGIVYRADGTIAQGTMLVSWPPFTAADGSTIAAGSTTATIAPDGTVSLSLAPNAGANPAGTYYTVVYHMNDGTVQTEYWVVPQSATATISEMRASVVPAAVAQQTISQQYVDASISALQGTYLQLKGGSMTGALSLAADPADAMQAATKEYVDAHAGAQLPQTQYVLAGSGNGGAVSVAEKGVNVSGSNGTVAWNEDLNAGIYDPRDLRWAGGINGPTPWLAAQAMSNQMACDLSMSKVKTAVARWPQGQFVLDQLLIAPGSQWIGAPNSTGGTTWMSRYNNHQLARVPASMTVTCSDGQQHIDNLGAALVSHFSLQGCSQGGCTNAPGDTASYAVGGPGNTGLQVSDGTSVVEYVNANAFGGYGIRVDGMDTKSFHLRLSANDEWYLYGNYKGYGESLPSAEANVTTTGTTGSVALSWAAVTNATAYAVYRGTASGAENVFYITTTNSFTDTGAASNSGSVSNVVTNTTGAPGTITATASATGGTLAAGTYYYAVTALTADGWHGSAELVGTDTMADWIESYGFFDVPNAFNYHHLTDILVGGGNGHFDHLWPQLGQVGIAEPYGLGGNSHIENFRADFARLEGIWITDNGVTLTDGLVDGSCTAANAATINTGQFRSTFAGTCTQFFSTGDSTNLSNTRFTDNAGFGPTYKTADILNEAGNSSTRNVTGTYQFIPAEGLLAGGYWSPQTTALTNVTGPQPSVMGLWQINPADTTPTNYTGFKNTQTGQDLLIRGGNANVTLKYNPQYLVTCSGRDINLGAVSGWLHFVTTNHPVYSLPGWVAEVCPSASLQSTLAGSETVAWSATPTFSTATRASVITLTGNVTSFTLAAGADGQEKTLTFCNDATGGYTVAAPANVRGFFTVGTTAGKCSSQHFTYAAVQTAWLADSTGVTNE